MNSEILSALLAAVSTIVGALLAGFFTLTVAKIQKKSGESGAKTVSGLDYRERMEKLTTDLNRASAEVDKTLQEMATVSREREEALKGLDAKLDELSKHERELQTRIDTLKQVPLPAVQYFLEVTEKGEKRSAARDYFLFASGVIVSTVIAIILRVFFNL